MRVARFASIVLAALAIASGAARAENWDHPGLVHLDKAGWVSPDDAAKKGFVEYRGRWVPQAMTKQLKAWEADDAKHAAWADAYKLDSKHYRIVTNVPRYIVELEIKPFLDELYETYVTVFKRDFGVSSKAANKKTIRIHYGFADYSAQEADQDGPPPRSNPGFILGGSELVVFYEETDPANFYGTVFHEGAHQFMAAVFPGAAFPMWLDEAMATYFEGCVYSRAERQIHVDHCPPDRLGRAIEILRSAKPDPGRSLAEKLFMDVPDAKFDAEQYALAWSFVWYLVNADDGRNREKFAKFLNEMNGAGTRSVPDVFQRATGLELSKLETGWRDFVLAQKVAPMPWYVRASWDENGPPAGCDLAKEDFVLAVDGVEVFDAAQFDRLWAARPADRPVALSLLRRSPCKGIVEYTETLLVAQVPAGADLKLVGDNAMLRTFNLRD